jgi:ferric-chelate reductase
MEVHPFTIASISNGPGGLVLLCKRTGDWTGSLYEMAKLAGYADEEGGLGKGVKRLVRVVVEGPYGSCSVLATVGPHR